MNSIDLPTWARYKYVLSGYRRPHISKLDCIKSIFSGCNESTNAITMMIASIISCGLYAYALNTRCSTWFDVSVYSAFLASCLVHAPFSIGFHTFRCISAETKERWRKLDLSFVLIASIFLTFALSAHVFPIHMTLFLTALSSFVACIGIYVIHNRHDVANKYFIIGCISVPVMIYLLPMVIHASVWTTVTIGALLCGMLVYVTSIPERFSPGRFDTVGHSHNIMHICLIVAHVAEFMWLAQK